MPQARFANPFQTPLTAGCPHGLWLTVRRWVSLEQRLAAPVGMTTNGWLAQDAWKSISPLARLLL